MEEKHDQEVDPQDTGLQPKAGENFPTANTRPT